ncbi:MAG: hypothetical protein NBV67_01385 [Tagaea sp.]|nr:hypothetical protein [Tagaea sp.]
MGVTTSFARDAEVALAETFLRDGYAIFDVEDRVALDAIRLGDYRHFAKLRPGYFAMGRSRLEPLVGNELAMQNRIDFSIQMPGDKTSLLDIYADVFSGETPYQVVMWTPLVDVHRPSRCSSCRARNPKRRSVRCPSLAPAA